MKLWLDPSLDSIFMQAQIRTGYVLRKVGSGSVKTTISKTFGSVYGRAVGMVCAMVKGSASATSDN